jgi:hypothetical protein
MVAHRKLDRRRVYLYAGESRKHALRLVKGLDFVPSSDAYAERAEIALGAKRLI